MVIHLSMSVCVSADTCASLFLVHTQCPYSLPARNNLSEKRNVYFFWRINTYVWLFICFFLDFYFARFVFVFKQFENVALFFLLRKTCFAVWAIIVMDRFDPCICTHTPACGADYFVCCCCRLLWVIFDGVLMLKVHSCLVNTVYILPLFHLRIEHHMTHVLLLFVSVCAFSVKSSHWYSGVERSKEKLRTINVYEQIECVSRWRQWRRWRRRLGATDDKNKYLSGKKVSSKLTMGHAFPFYSATASIYTTHCDRIGRFLEKQHIHSIGRDVKSINEYGKRNRRHE